MQTLFREAGRILEEEEILRGNKRKEVSDTRIFMIENGFSFKRREYFPKNVYIFIPTKYLSKSYWFNGNSKRIELAAKNKEAIIIKKNEFSDPAILEYFDELSKSKEYYIASFGTSGIYYRCEDIYYKGEKTDLSESDIVMETIVEFLNKNTDDKTN